MDLIGFLLSAFDCLICAFLGLEVVRSSKDLACWGVLRCLMFETRRWSPVILSL